MNPLANSLLSYSVFRCLSHLNFWRGPIVMSLCPPWCMNSFLMAKYFNTPTDAESWFQASGAKFTAGICPSAHSSDAN